jgi:probable rRNA maturation factor
MSAEAVGLSLEIVCDEPRWGELDALAPAIGIWAAAAARALGDQGESGSFAAALKLANDAEVRELNHRYRGKDQPTNVLSFPFGDDWPEETGAEPLPLGDIIIAFETVEREAAEQGKPFRHHLAHLVVHGILHLYGFDHEDDAEAEAMEALERDILAQLAIPSPYEETGLSDI